MQIPNLPTDNLYKFMALTGLVLVVIGIIPYWVGGTKTQEIAGQVLAKQIILIEAEIADDDEFSRHEVAKLRGEIKQLKFQWDRLLQDRKFLRTLSSAFYSFGTFLSCFGFVLWYTRVQIYQDLLLKKQATAETKHSSNDG